MIQGVVIALCLPKTAWPPTFTRSRERAVRGHGKKLAKKCHPDINKEAGAEENFQKINEAYGVLSDETIRKVYVQKVNSSNKTYSNSSRASGGTNQKGKREFWQKGTY